MKALSRLVILLLAFILIIPGSTALAETQASSLQEFSAQVEQHAANLEKTYTVPCGKALMDELKKSSSAVGGSTPLTEIMLLAGNFGPFSITYYDDHILLDQIIYYPGWRIAHLWKSGNTEAMTEREKQTLDEALALVSGIPGGDLEKERYIYDALCGRITYDLTDDGTGDKDCAIGALLNGRADCDGYADAMLLCCSLAGIPCKYMHGHATKPVQAGADTNSSHMWNLVFIKGSWLICDVTWGDQPGGPSYIYFNIGSQDAAVSYQWNPGTLFTEIADKANFETQLTPDLRPVEIHSLEDVYYAARTSALAGSRLLNIFSPDEAFWKTAYDAFQLQLRRGAFGTYSYADSGRLFEIYNISLPEDVFCFCDTEQAILSAVQFFAENDTRSFSLYLLPSLAEQMFADDHAKLQETLSMSSLDSAGQYSYSVEYGSVSFTNAAFTEALPVCATTEEMQSLIHNQLLSRPSTLSFLLSGGLQIDTIQEQMSVAVYSQGVSSFAYSLTGNRITLLDLEYFDHCCFAESRNDVLTYMRAAKENGTTDLRFYCSESLYASLSANNAVDFFSLLQEAGFKEFNVSHSDAYCLMIVEGAR